MGQHIVKVKTVEKITHDVLKIVTERPPQYIFIPGQATDISINKDGWKDEKRPFTFTCLPSSDYLEFTIKTYPSHKGVTSELLKLKRDDELILYNVFGALAYKGEGVFIAGGAGVTPFICIFRYLQSIHKIGNNKLIFANKTKADIILEQELKKMLGKNFVNILSDEIADGYAHGQITEGFLREQFNAPATYIYLCGPPPMMDAVEKQLANLQVVKNSIIKEDF